ncbi:cytochrome b/b6 domain-containing protein [Ramlibacter sp. PS4R-6]|uniref:cytochrome b/b6 domain-containing protein n=1 Tax=Ramlibacter sp. PS4R-6 TaxID=3133438 RepID=UPI003098B9D7
MEAATTLRTKVWDLPTRVFHWLLAACAVGLLVTGKMKGDALEWHARIGYCVGALLLFRLVWGFVGGRWSRFAAFAPSPARAWAYLRGAHADAPGHNPLGAFSVYALLLFFALQVASGLFSATKEDFAAPLSVLVSNDTVRFMTGYHKRVGQVVLIVLVSLHLIAVLYYLARGRNLVAAMVHGEQAGPGEPSRDDARSRWLAVALLSLCSLVMYCVVKLGG